MRRRALPMVVLAFAGAAACNAVTGVHDLTFVDGVAGAGSSTNAVAVAVAGGGENGGGAGGVGGAEPCGTQTEVCFDEVDNDCDDEIDEQCPCSDSVDLCKDSNGMILVDDVDHLLVVPDRVVKGTPFDLYLVSKMPLDNAVLRINSIYCAGASGTSDCEEGDGCPGWSVIRQRVETTDPVFMGGYAQLTLLINEDDTDPPCDGDHERTVSAQVFILPSD